MATLKHREIVYCIVKILSKSPDFNVNTIYSVRNCPSSQMEDAVLTLISGALLLITQTIDISLGEFFRC